MTRYRRAWCWHGLPSQRPSDKDQITALKRSLKTGEATHLVANVTTRNLATGENRYSCNFGLSLNITTYSLAEDLNNNGFKIFGYDGGEIPVDYNTEFILDADQTVYYHVQGGGNVGPIRQVRTGLTETPDNLKQIAENTQTPANSDNVNYNNIFNYYPTGDTSTDSLDARNPCAVCIDSGPCGE